MKVLRKIKKLEGTSPSIITVGVFDGVHRGHGEVINTLVKEGDKGNYKKIVITFKNHPLCILNPSCCPLLLTTVEEKIHVFREFDIDFLVILDFDKKFSLFSVEDFIKNILMEKFNMKKLVAGYDATIGKNKGGDVETLRKLAGKLDFSLKVVEPEIFNSKDIVSSSLIREVISEGDVKRASLLLGRPYYMKGKVVRGEEMGRKYGFPTANLSLRKEKLLPARGVYAVRVIYGEQEYGAIANVGVKPTMGVYEPGVEVYIFDFSHSIYGSELTLKFIDRIRGEKKFPEKEDLYRQIKKDIKIAENMIGQKILT